MPFIEQRSHQHEYHGPKSYCWKIKVQVKDRTICEKSQDTVLRHVAAFADEDVPEIDLIDRQSRKEKGECGNDELRRLIRGESVRRKIKHRQEADDDRQLVFGETYSISIRQYGRRRCSRR